MTDYVDRCLCGNFVTQNEVDLGECSECGRGTSNLSDAWSDWEEQQIARADEEEALQANSTQKTTSANSTYTGG